MPKLSSAIDQVLTAQKKSKKPLAIILAGHNGAGKSTMWYKSLSKRLQIPLINADRMMLSILPELEPGQLPKWARKIRDADPSWMKVAQNGVQAFVAHAMASGVPFAMETVFSHWREFERGRVESKIQLIEELQAAGYFVVLLFVGLSSDQLSIGRVHTRVSEGGHGVTATKLRSRFPRTQIAIGRAVFVADAAILTDNSRAPSRAFTVCQVRLKKRVIFDIRQAMKRIPRAISAWMDVVAPV